MGVLPVVSQVSKLANEIAPISHLLYVDVLLIFGKTTMVEVSNILKNIDLYCKVYGQKVNYSSFRIFCSKAVSNEKCDSDGMGIVG